MRRAVALLALALLAGCATHSRSTLAQRRLRDKDADDPAVLSSLRGSDPLVPSTWLISATRQQTPEAALDIVQRGLRYNPGQPDLVWADVSLYAHMGKRTEQLAAARKALADSPPSELEQELRQFLVDGLLAQDDPFSAADEARRLGGVSGADPELVSSAWAAVALSFEFLAHQDEADESMDHSLDLGARGVVTLRQLAAMAPERAAAARQIVERAAERRPGHPDLQQYLVVEKMLAKDYAGAEQALADMPQPLPSRMWSDVEAIHARLDLLQDRIEPGLARLRQRLDAWPGDAAALAVLIECWQTRHQPAEAEMIERLRAALQGRLGDPALAAQIEAALQRLEATQPPAPRP